MAQVYPCRRAQPRVPPTPSKKLLAISLSELLRHHPAWSDVCDAPSGLPCRSLARPATESRSSIPIDDATVLSDDRLEAGQQWQPHRPDSAEPDGRLRFPVQPVAPVAHAHEYRHDQPAF